MIIIVFLTIATRHEPYNNYEATSDPLWQKAMFNELQALLKTRTWDLVNLPLGKPVVGRKWVYNIKTQADGSIEQYKARLLAQGFTQEYGINYEKTFAPVPYLISLDLYFRCNYSIVEPISHGCEECNS